MDTQTNITEMTGSFDLDQNIRLIDYAFGPFQVKIRVNESNQFLGITEISINKQFVNPITIANKKGFEEIEEYYKEK